jgi:hypothetical protein
MSGREWLLLALVIAYYGAKEVRLWLRKRRVR